MHTKRLIHQLIPLNETHRQDLSRVRAQGWKWYAELKAYKKQPAAAKTGE
jgi:hypothetical protein